MSDSSFVFLISFFCGGLFGYISDSVFVVLISFFAGAMLESWVHAGFLRQEMDLGLN
jgi:hypothetical protein